jgi:lipoprotein
MVKYISIILLTLLSSCIATGKWNEIGRKRFSLSRFSLHANKGEEQKIKNMIDLNSIYKKITLSPPQKENYTYQTYIYRFYIIGKTKCLKQQNEMSKKF